MADVMKGNPNRELTREEYEIKSPSQKQKRREMIYEQDLAQRKRYVETISIFYFVDSYTSRCLWGYSEWQRYTHASAKQ